MSHPACPMWIPLSYYPLHKHTYVYMYILLNENEEINELENLLLQLCASKRGDYNGELEQIETRCGFVSTLIDVEYSFFNLPRSIHVGIGEMRAKCVHNYRFRV